jgi:hypothetical protein
MKAKSGEAKKNGQLAAKEWCKTIRLSEQINLAGADLKYGETLDELAADGFAVPPSADRDYSWGFYKKVKGKVTHAMDLQRRANSNR